MTIDAGRVSAGGTPMHMRQGDKKLPHVPRYVHLSKAGQISDEIPALHELKDQ